MPSRRSIRLPGYDYTRPGAYFVTICTYRRACLFGEVVDGEIRLNAAGIVAARGWRAIPTHHPHVTLDACVVMPNHLHGILLLMPPSDGPVSGADVRPPKEAHGAGTPAGSLGALVQNYKSVVARRVNGQQGTPGGRLWHRNDWERVIRNERELDATRRYIRDNPQRWTQDRLHPERSA